MAEYWCSTTRQRRHRGASRDEVGRGVEGVCGRELSGCENRAPPVVLGGKDADEAQAGADDAGPPYATLDGSLRGSTHWCRQPHAFGQHGRAAEITIFDGTASRAGWSGVSRAKRLRVNLYAKPCTAARRRPLLSMMLPLLPSRQYLGGLPTPSTRPHETTGGGNLWRFHVCGPGAVPAAQGSREVAAQRWKAGRGMSGGANGSGAAGARGRA